jgi:hypothetical protein
MGADKREARVPFVFALTRVNANTLITAYIL